MPVPKLAPGAMAAITFGDLVFLAGRITDNGREYVTVRCLRDDHSERFDTEEEAHEFAKNYRPKVHETN